MHIQLFMCENVHKFWSTLGHAYTEYSMDGRKGVHSQLGAHAHKKHYRIDEEPLAVPVCKRRHSTIPAYNSRSDASNTLHHFLLFLQLSFRRPSADLWAGAAGSGNCDRSSEGGGEKKEKKSFLANVNNKTIMEIRLVMQPTLRLAETPCGTYNTHQEGWSTVSHQLWWQFCTTSEIEMVDCPLPVPPIFGGFYFQQSIQNECLFKLCHWFNFQQTAVRFVKSLSFNNLPVNQPNNSLVLCVFVNWHLHLICEVYPLAPFLPHSMLSVTSVTLGPSDRKLFNIDVWLGVFH